MSLHIQLQLQQPQNCMTDPTRKATLIVHGHSTEQLQLACCPSQQTLLNAVECNQTRHLAMCCAIEVPANRPFNPVCFHQVSSTQPPAQHPTPRHSQRHKAPLSSTCSRLGTLSGQARMNSALGCHPGSSHPPDTPPQKTKWCTHGTTKRTQHTHFQQTLCR